MIQTRYLAYCFIAISLFSGCGDTGSAQPGETNPEYSNSQPLDAVKAKLAAIAETGKFGGSELMGIDASLIAAGKPELAQKLKGLKLSQEPNPRNKKVAQEVIDELEEQQE